MMRDSIPRTLRALALGALLVAVHVPAHAAEQEPIPAPGGAGIRVSVEIAPRPVDTTTPPAPEDDWGVAPVVLPPLDSPARPGKVPAEVTTTSELPRTGSAVLPALAAAAALVVGGTALRARRTPAPTTPA